MAIDAKRKTAGDSIHSLIPRNDDNIDSIRTFQDTPLFDIALVTSIISYLSPLLHNVLHHPWESEYYSVILSRHLHTCTQPWLHTPDGEEIVESVLPTLNWKACLNQLLVSPFCSDKDGFYEWRLNIHMKTEHLQEHFPVKDVEEICDGESSVFGNNCSNDVYNVSSDFRERNHKTNS